ncbi:hypothetical protein CC78DRAFT_622378 [Lojkania enalia]|uniref:Mitochondrial export protein Som1 n=1 Tax=Lojkania enalia TaxID=147567 RepID=A0A9P4JXY5_9PLEO|nr:hypothetical protein CC78DRAFT_622378 [Didymosphaeria enalia]
MAPPIPTFPLSTLTSQLQELPHGKTRNPPLDLASCALKELVQYRCNLAAADGGPPAKGKPIVIVCEPVVRFYRQCADGLMVETTAWEGWKERQGGSQAVGETSR